MSGNDRHVSRRWKVHLFGYGSLLSLAGCAAVGVGGSIALALLSGLYLGRIRVEFDPGTEAATRSDNEGDVRLRFGTSAGGSAVLRSYEGVLPGFSEAGATQASVDLDAGTVSGTVTTPEGDVLDLADILPGLRVNALDSSGVQETESASGGFEIAFDDEAQGVSYRYQMDMTAESTDEAGDRIRAPVRVIRRLVQNGTTVLDDSADGEITAERESQDEAGRRLPLGPLPPPVICDAGPDQTIIEGESVVLEGSVRGGSGNLSFSWTPSTDLDDSSALRPLANPNLTTTYQFTASDSVGQLAIDVTTVTVAAAPRPTLTVTAGADVQIFAGEAVSLQAVVNGEVGDITVVWSPATGLDDPNSLLTSASPTVTTTYTVTVTDSAGNTATDTMTVLVDTSNAPAVVDPVGASGDFTTTSGEFEVAVSPQDSAGNFIGTGLPQSAFGFQDVIMVPEAGGATVQVTATVTGIDVIEPSGGQGQPITAIVIFDSSGSMSDNDPGAVGRSAAGQAFFDVLRSSDEVAVLDFGAGVDSGLTDSRLLQDFTSDRNLLDAALAQLTESGGTPLWESILDGLSLLSNRLGTGGALVVLTDGEADDFNLSTVISQATAQDVPVYPIGLGQNLDFTQLRDAANQTGGSFAEAGDSSALAAVFQGIGTGITVGKVTVFGQGTYTNIPLGRYSVQGDLVTSGFVTPFQFTVDVTE